jgi:tetratricopeptide (TPR) repeat protein
MLETNLLPPTAAPSVEETLLQMESLYAQGKLLQAYQIGTQWGDPADWPGTAATILAGRILNNLGAPRTGRKLHYLSYRHNPADLQATYYCAFGILERRGPLAAIEFWETHHPHASADSPTYSDWLAMRGTFAGIYRDFETADAFITRAEEAGTEKAWIRVERSRLLEGQDQYQRALEVAKSSLELVPWYRPGVHHVAHLLQVLDRDAEALELLEQAVDHIESALILQQLAALQDQLQLYEKAAQTLEKIDAVCPIREIKFQRQLAILRSNVAYHAGNFSLAADFAETSKHPQMLRVAEKLRSHDATQSRHPRVLLDLPFVRQHFMTCAPATIAAIGRFFSKATDHLTVVDAICYDGTAAYSQRQWAEKNGWIAREFTVSWDATVALIDRGVPYMLATMQITSGHMQAVVGYDQIRGTLLCRDPYQYYLSEFHAQMLLEQQAAGGPRAMVIVPETRGHLLENLDLPDAALYDLLHEVEKSLAKHDRGTAAEAAKKLSIDFPEHRLTFQAQRALASYDANSPAGLAAVDGLLKTYPKDAPLLFVKALFLRSLERTDLLLPLLEQLCGQHTVDASFLQLYAEQIDRQTADQKKVQSLLKRALRRQPLHAQCLIAMGNQLWGQRKLEKATALYQLAASVDSMNEASVQTYFNASRYLKKTDAALSLLKKRYERLISRSSAPARTYFIALDTLDRTVQAYEILDEARSKRPDDGALLIYCADAYGRKADFPKARELLQAASGKTHQAQWLRTSARLSAYEGDLLAALSIWNQLLESEPLAPDANREVARLIAQTQSPDAAARHLEQVMQRFPYNTEIAQIRISWLRSRGHAAIAEAAAALVAKQPANVWAQVELALSLSHLGRNQEALDHANASLAIAPHATSPLFARGNALQQMLKLDEAREAYRDAIRISVDYPFAISALVDSFGSAEQKREALAFVHSEILRQVVFGEAILTYRREAKPVLDAQTLLDHLQMFKTSRPDLWQTWSMMIYQLADMGRVDEAVTIAREAVDRFPLLPRMWYDLSYITGLKADRPGKIAALIQCMALSPGWSFAARQLADTYRLEGQDDQAMAVLKRAIPRDPLDAVNYHAHAWQLWNQKEKQAAIDHVKKALTLEPGLSKAWETLQNWLYELKRQNELEPFAREICRQRAGESVSWLILARVLEGRQTLDERLAAVDSAIALSPLDSEAHDLKAMLLLEQGNMDAALAACDPPQFAGNPPVELRGRHAWIYAQKKQVPKAIDLMIDILNTTRTYYWGWAQLMNWLSKQKRPADYLLHAEAMVRQFPHDAVARNHLSSAQLQNKDAKTAKQTLVDALHVTPDNVFALNKLFDAQIKDGELAAAGKTLDLIQRHMVTSEFLFRQVILAANLKDHETAAAGLAQLCTAEHFELNALTKAVNIMDVVKMQDRVNAVFNQTAQNNRNLPAGVVSFWMQRTAKSMQWKACQKILELFEINSPQWLDAAVAYLDGTTKARQYARANKFSRQQLKRSDLQTRLWGQIGFSLFSQNDSRSTIRAMRDWEKRADAAAWMLVNLAHACRRTNQFDLANRVQQFAVKLPADHTTLKHQVWLALDEVTAGVQGDSYKAVLAADTSKLDKHYPYLLKLIRALGPLAAPETAGAQECQTARKALSAAAVKVPGWKSQRELRLAMRRAVARLVGLQPTFTNRLWQAMWVMRTAPEARNTRG